MMFKKENIKWLVLVPLNAAISLLIALDMVRSVQGFIGILLAIATFLFLYMSFDSYLKRKGYETWQKAFFIAAILSVGLQFIFIIPMVLGAIAIDFIQSIFSIQPSLSLESLNVFHIYLITLTDAALLSLLVGGITLIIRLLMALWENYRTSVSVTG